MMPSYNLISEPWIPVKDGASTRLVGLREALIHAERIERLTSLSPLAEVAVTRLLLAVLHRALAGPRDTIEAVELYETGRFPQDQLEGYLDRWESRFDLFHPDHPFFQVPDLPEEAPLPWTKLLPEYATGNNPTLFDHTLDREPPRASPAEAARALLVHQAFAPGGIIRRLGVTAGKAGPLASVAVFLPQGSTLFETLLLNWAPYRREDDEPLWERAPYRTADIERGRTRLMLSGRTRVYTWMSRSVKLLPEDSGGVRLMTYGPGVVPLDESPELDPMCAHQKEKGNVRAYRLRRDLAFWQDFEAILPGQAGWEPPQVLGHAADFLKELGRVRRLFPLVVIGQLTDQAKVLDVRRETYPLSLQSLTPEVAPRIHEALEHARETGKVLHRAGWALGVRLLSRGDRSPPDKDVRQFVNSLPLHTVYWPTLQAEFPAFLERLTLESPEKALEVWKGAIWKARKNAWDQAVAAVGATPLHLRAAVKAEQVLRSQRRRAA